MNYDIKITSSGHEAVPLEFDQLAAIIKSTKDIAQKALMLKLYGYSGLSLPAYLKDSLKIYAERLIANKEGLHLLVDADALAERIKFFQQDVFRPELSEDLKSLTPMSLVILAFRSALTETDERNNLDKPLLKSLLQFRKSFSKANEVFQFSNRQSVPAIEVKLEDFEKIALLDESTPDPKRVIIKGRLDEMKYSKSKLVMITEDGPVNILIKDNSTGQIERLKDFFGKDFTVQGMANFRPGGVLSFVVLERFSLPNKSDEYFSRISSEMDARQQLLFQMQKGGNRTALENLQGQWPGDESDAAFEQLLKDLD